MRRWQRRMLAMRTIIGTTLAFTMSLVSGSVAESYPARPITIVSPFPAGSPVDTVARIVGQGMKAPLRQTLVIDNVTGAGGTIGVARAARAPADGYVISLGNFSSHVVAGAIYPTQYDALNDL